MHRYHLQGPSYLSCCVWSLSLDPPPSSPPRTGSWSWRTSSAMAGSGVAVRLHEFREDCRKADDLTQNRLVWGETYVDYIQDSWVESMLSTQRIVVSPWTLSVPPRVP
ncbi:hypothetical protein FQN60_005332 [Etheostoma spectabile]|uniref:Uncharacterized protein n=1 Tax=Etheostoma spectabile TaxID=54343 RepID=A0A5J5C7T7_9PERO|nr:hypothetical protein FQN60_005332 [Etheostoma spectabile]